MAKTKYENYVFPAGTARFPKINEPDTQGKFADGKFKTDIVYDAATTKKIKDDLLAAAKRLCPDVDSPRIPLKKDKKDGTPFFAMKSKNRPVMFDARKNRIADKLFTTKAVELRSGSIIRPSCVLIPYEGGIAAFMDAVQILELSERGLGAKAFDEVDDGYAFDAASIPSADESSADDAGKAAVDDYAL